MVGIDSLIFGYRRITISPDDLSEVTSILLRNSIFSRINPDGTLTVRERDFEKMQTLFKGRIEFEYSETLGLYGKYKSIPHKAAYISAILISLIFIIFSSNFVWDIRVEGNEAIPDAEIILGLNKCGLSVGDFWSMIDCGCIESSYSENEKRISWININRRGSVAYVKVIERETNEKNEENLPLYSNIVSEYDCVIEELTVKQGTAVVKPGDVVKKGDVLIIGVLPEEVGGGFCSAEGSVIGRVNDKIFASADRKYEKVIGKNKKIYSVDINFFNFSLNIFKLYGNLTNKCDIIETEKTYSLFSDYRLPFSISVKYITEYFYQESEYTDEELIELVSSRLNFLTIERLSCSDLLRIRTHGNFSDEGYYMISEIVCLSEVSRRIAFNVQ